MEMRCFTPGARTQPATAITACAVLENALFYAWSKSTAGNSNYGLRGAGECCLVPTITKIERTRLRSVQCRLMLFCARSGT